jgi:hypothetical protein
MHPVSLAEIEQLARNHGALVALALPLADRQSRPGISWTGVVLRLPDDGTGALPLLRHVILNDQKSATYKLGLLRALCRAADGQAGMAEARGDDAVVLPLGLVALNWLRLYLPLVEAKLPKAFARCWAVWWRVSICAPVRASPVPQRLRCTRRCRRRPTSSRRCRRHT